MRKDIFIVGARLLGIWLVLEAVNPLIYIIGSWIGNFTTNLYSQDYSLINVIVHIAAGLYLLLKTNELFDLLEKVLSESKDSE